MRKSSLLIIITTALLLGVPICFSQDSTQIVNKEKQRLYFGISNQVVSNYVPKVGIQIGEGFANQNLAYLSYSGFKIFGFLNYGIPERSTTGILYGVQYKFKLPFKTKGTVLHNILAINKYTFPSFDLDNWVADYFFMITGRIQTTFQYSHLFKAGEVRHGDRIFAIAELPVNYNLFNLNSVFTPEISSAYHNNFYDKTGLAHFTIGLRNKILMDRFSVNAFIKYQYSFKSIQEYQESGFYGGIGVSLFGNI